MKPKRLYRPLVAGCSIGHKPHLLLVSTWDMEQSKKNYSCHRGRLVTSVSLHRVWCGCLCWRQCFLFHVKLFRPKRRLCLRSKVCLLGSSVLCCLSWSRELLFFFIFALLRVCLCFSCVCVWVSFQWQWKYWPQKSRLCFLCCLFVCLEAGSLRNYCWDSGW